MKKEKPALTQPPQSGKPGKASEVDDMSATPVQGVVPDQVDSPARDTPTEPETQAAEPPVAPEAVATESAPGDGPAGDGATTAASDRPESDQAPDPAPTAAEPAVSAIPIQTEAAAPSRVPVVIAVAALVVAALSGWQVFEQRGIAKELRDELAQRLTGADVTVGEVRALTRQNQETIAALQGRLGGFDAKLAATEGQAAALEALYQEHSRSRNDQVLAEVEQAINIAAQQLQLAGNFEAALIALEGADARLAMPDQAHLQALRRALIKDLDNVRAHPRVDVSGLALRLEILLAKVDTLPLAYEFSLSESAAIGKPVEPVAVDTEAGIVDQATAYMRTLAADMWEEVRRMIRLERLDHVDPALLAPAQSTFLRENVKIRLLTARLALLARDGRTYSADLAQARAWIERYFDTREEEVKRVIADLTELENQSISAQPPTLEETFAALRIVQARTPGAQRDIPQSNSGAESDTATANR